MAIKLLDVVAAGIWTGIDNVLVHKLAHSREGFFDLGKVERV
jgi:hypothetical protein